MNWRSLFHYLRPLTAVASVLLFTWMLSRAGLSSIIDQTRLLGAGLALLILLSGARTLLRAAAWQRCVKTEDRHLGLIDLFVLRLAGDAITDMTPAGPLLGEPARIAAASKYMPALASTSSILIEMMIYSFATLLFMLSGGALAVFAVGAPRGFQWIVGGLLLSLLVSVPVAWWVVARRIRVLGGILDYLKNGSLKWKHLERHEQAVRNFEESFHDFFSNRRSVLFLIFIIEFATNFTGVAEAYVILKATTAHASLLAAYLVESVSRAVQIAFTFIPFGLGVQEGAAASTLQMVGYTASEGVSLAIIRKIRILFWFGIGMILVSNSFTAGALRPLRNKRSE